MIFDFNKRYIMYHYSPIVISLSSLRCFLPKSKMTINAAEYEVIKLIIAPLMPKAGIKTKLSPIFTKAAIIAVSEDIIAPRVPIEFRSEA